MAIPKVLFNSPSPFPHVKTYTKEMEASHSARETEKTLFGSYESAEDGEISTDSMDLLKAIVTKVKREHIDSVYKTGPGKFVVLKDTKHKDFYNQEINFREKVCNIDHTFRLLPERPKRLHFKQKMYDENTVYITMFLPTTISDMAVKVAFNDLGEVHSVFTGSYKFPFDGISNSKRHVRITPYDKSELPHKIEFEGTKRTFKVFWAEKVVMCKVCTIAHILKTSCEDAQKSMESGDSAGENVSANREPVESDLAAAVNRHQTHPSEMREQDQQTLFEPLDRNYYQDRDLET